MTVATGKDEGQEVSTGSPTASSESLVVFYMAWRTVSRRTVRKEGECVYFSMFIVNDDGEEHKLGPLQILNSCSVPKC